MSLLSTTLAKRYAQLRQRSFDRHMDLYLTVRLLNHPPQPGDLTPLDYQAFVPNESDWVIYRHTHQAKDWFESLGNKWTVQTLDGAINDWWATNTAAIAEFKAIHHATHCVSEAEFHRLFNPPGAELACAYCRINETELRALVVADQVFTKRLRARGINFEVDCRKPERGYLFENLSLCCYWCNNAKTDEFTDSEFAPVAHALGLIWKQRLKKA